MLDERIMDLKKTYATVLMVALTAFIVYSLLPYINAFFGAIILYTIFYPLYDILTDKWRLKRSTSSIAVIFFSIFIITIPFLYTMGLIVNEARMMSTYIDEVPKWLDGANKVAPGLNLGDLISGQLTKAVGMIQDQFVSMVLSLTQTLINITIMYFLLYYMLIHHHELPAMAIAVSPFNEKNTRRLAHEISSVTYGTIITQGAVGALHGALLGIGLHVFGISQAIFWGFISAVLSFLPAFGTPMIWIPAGIFKIASGDMYSGVGILVWGLILTNLDSIVRPLIQFKVSKMHPIISVLGFFIGVSYFGVLGIIVGPLLLTYFFLMFEMFQEEYLSSGIGGRS
jgi:predicted PurR-regulated permease PerM